MKHHIIFGIFFFVFGFGTTNTVVSSSAAATVGETPIGQRESWEVFIDGLLARDYYDTAIEYLETMRKKPTCPPTLAAQMDYQLGLIHVQSLLSTNPTSPREEHFRQAKTAFTTFLAQTPSPPPPTVMVANTKMAGLLFEESKRTSPQNNAQSDGDTVRREKLQAALIFAKAAETAAREVANSVKNTAHTIKDKEKEMEFQQKQVAAGTELCRCRLFILELETQIAVTFPEGSPETVEKWTNLRAAAGEFITKYKDSLPFETDSAKLIAAKCHIHLGQPEQARLFLQELAVIPENSQSAPLKMEIVRTSLQLDSAQKNDTTIPKTSQASIGTPISSKSSKPVDFPSAKEAADQTWDDFVVEFQQNEKNQENGVSSHLTGHSTGQVSPQFGETLDRAILAIEQLGELGKLSNDTERTLYPYKLNLATLYFLKQRYQESASLAATLAMEYPSADRAIQTADLAIKGYRAAFIAARSDGETGDKEWENIRQLTEWICKRWENQPITQDSLFTFIATALDRGNTAAAMEMMTLLPESSPYRAAAELRLGQLLWNSASRGVTEWSGDLSSEDQKNFREQIDTAKQSLIRGIEWKVATFREGAVVDNDTIAAMLTVAQISLQNENPQESLAWMRKPLYGPTTLFNQEPPVVLLSPAMKIAVLTMELRLCVELQQFDEAEIRMQQLETEVQKNGNVNNIADQLTSIYIALGRQTESRLKQLTAEGKTAEITKVTEGFKTFLKRIGERPDTTFQVRYWVADTYYRFGMGMTAPQSEPPLAALEYFKEAARVYNSVLKTIATTPDWAPPKSETMVRVRLAESLRILGFYEQSLKILGDVLKENENLLDAQVEAAKVYQSWGKKDITYFSTAILGTDKKPDGQHRIWGWNGLITKTTRGVETDDRMKNVYYESQLSKVRCLIEIARNETDPQRKKSLLETAETTISRLQQTRPDLGGPEWKLRFDTDRMRIQSL